MSTITNNGTDNSFFVEEKKLKPTFLSRSILIILPIFIIAVLAIMVWHLILGNVQSKELDGANRLAQEYIAKNSAVIWEANYSKDFKNDTITVVFKRADKYGIYSVVGPSVTFPEAKVDKAKEQFNGVTDGQKYRLEYQPRTLTDYSDTFPQFNDYDCMKPIPIKSAK